MSALRPLGSLRSAVCGLQDTKAAGSWAVAATDGFVITFAMPTDGVDEVVEDLGWHPVEGVRFLAGVEPDEHLPGGGIVVRAEKAG